MKREPRIFKQTLTPLNPPRFFKMEKIEPVVLAEFPGSEHKTDKNRGDILEAEEATAHRYMVYGWCKPLPGQGIPGQPLPSQAEPFDPNNPPAPPVVKLPKTLRVRLLKPNVVLGSGIQNAVVGEKYTLPTGDALYLKGQGVVEEVDDLPKPEIQTQVIRAESNRSPGVSEAAAAKSWRESVDFRLGRK